MNFRLRYSLYLVILLAATSQSTNSTDKLDHLELSEHLNKSREGFSTLNPTQLAENLKSEFTKLLESEPTPGFSESSSGQDVTKTSGKRIHPRKGVDAIDIVPESKEDLKVNNNATKVIPLKPALLPQRILSNQTQPAPNITASPSNNSTESPRHNTTIKIVSTLIATTEKPMILTTVKPLIKPVAKKPQISFSAYDDPEIISNYMKKKLIKLAQEKKDAVKDTKENLVVEEPIVEELSNKPVVKENHRKYLIYVILIFVLPTFLGLVTIAVKKFRENWATRQYRRVDFLVDGMYDH